MTSTDLKSCPIVETKDGYAVQTMVDGIMDVKVGRSLHEKYKHNPKATSAFLINHGSLEELFILWDMYGKPKVYYDIEEETNIDVLSLYRDIGDNQRVLQEAHKNLQDTMDQVKRTMDMIITQNRKWEFVKRRLKVNLK
jgi:hypothetical protein